MCLCIDIAGRMRAQLLLKVIMMHSLCPRFNLDLHNEPTQPFQGTTVLHTRVGQRVEVSTEHQWNAIGFTGNRGQLEAARRLVHDVLYFRQEHHGLNQLDVRVFRVPVHVGVGYQQQLLLHAVQ